MLKCLSLCCVWLWIALTPAFAQEKIITGKVIAVEDNSAIPGVNVTVKGTTIGTVTDTEGKYSISLTSSNTILVFSFVGFISQEIQAGNRTVIDVKLASDLQELSEVVVTAVGIERENRALGYSVEKVDAGKLQQVSEPDPLRALQGKVAGVNISGSSGVPGSSTRITIRGNSSFLGNNQPLFVVDGVPYNNEQYSTSNQLVAGGAYGSRISDLDPNNIESITVLKGGAAAALYGIRAANGVVVITTKTGSKLSSRKGLEVSFSTGYSLEKIANLPDYQNTYGTGTKFVYQEVNGSWGAAFNGAAGYPTIDSIPYWQNLAQVFPDRAGNVPYRPYPNNVRNFFDTGRVMENSVSVTTGRDNYNISVVASKTDQKGYVPKSSFDRTNLSLGGSVKLANNLTVGGNFSYTVTKQAGPPGGLSASSVFARTLYLGRNWDLQGQPYENPNTRGNVFFVAPGQAVSPYWSAKYDGFRADVDRITSGVNASYDILPWLTASYKIGINTYTQRNQEWYRPGGSPTSAGGLGQVIDDDVTFTEIESNFILSANKALNENFTLRALIGHNVNQRTSDRQSVKGNNMVDFNIIDIDNTNNVVPNGGEYFRRRLYGMYGEATLSYRDFTFLTVTGRNDWSSTLPKNSRSFFYPAISGSLVFTDALNLKSNILTMGKLTANWSTVGNDADPYSLVPNYFINFGTSTNLVGSLQGNDFPFKGIPSATLSDTDIDPNLKPEFTTTVEVGTELNFFNGRANLNVTLYDKRTTDQIAQQSLPTVSGFASYLTNFGEMSNRGIEIGLDVTPLSFSNGFKWNIYGAFTHNKNKVESLTEGVDQIVIRNLFAGGIAPVLRPGQEYGIFLGSRSLRDDEGNFLIDPANGQLLPDPEFSIVGNPNPDFIVGLTNTFSFRGIFLSAVFDWRQGGDVFSQTNQAMLGRGILKITEDRERNFVIPGVLANPNTGEPLRDPETGEKIPNNIQIEGNDVYFGQTFGVNGSDEFSVWDGTTFRLREVAVGYDIPKKWIGKTPFGSARLTFTGRNLWFKAPNFPEGSNFDPETNTFGNTNAQGFEYQNAPSVKRYGVNLRFTF